MRSICGAQREHADDQTCAYEMGTDAQDEGDKGREGSRLRHGVAMQVRHEAFETFAARPDLAL